MIKELLATALFTGSLGAVSGGDITQDTWIHNTLILNNLTISGDLTYVAKCNVTSGGGVEKPCGVVYNVHYTYTFDTHFTSTSPMYQNYITLKELELYPSLVVSVDNVVYSEYADNSTYYTFPNDYRVYATGNLNEGYSGFAQNNAFNLVANIYFDWDDFSTTGYVIYMGQSNFASLYNGADGDYYGFNSQYVFYNNKGDVKGNFDDDFSVILDSADEWAMHINQNSSGGSYQNGYEDGYADGTNNTPNGVFSVVASAFNSVTSFLNLHIAPNITLGMLLSIPIIVAIVFVIIKFVKG